jgi:Na+-driven multidrug efflux pump
VFRGQGKTIPSSVASISSNLLRVALAYGFTYFTDWGLTGIWIAFSASAAIRGLWIFTWYLLYSRGLPKMDTVLTVEDPELGERNDYCIEETT